MTGEPRNPDFGRIMTGHDQCVLHGTITFAQLGKRCSDLIDAYTRADYRHRFGWIDQMSVVHDESLTDTLDAKLAAAFRQHDFNVLHLAAPEVIDWADVEGFRYTPDPKASALRPDLDAAEYVEAHEARGRGDLDESRLRKDRVLLFGGAANAQLASWQVYRCSVFQTHFANKLYVLSGGTWYEVEKTFADDIDHQIGTIAELSAADMGLPAANPDEHEEDYLIRAAPLVEQALATPVVVMDQLMVRAADAASDIEVCDLFTGAKQFIHAKRRTRSSTLSHLFAQGMGSAQAFAGDETYRRLAREAIVGTACGTTEYFPTQKPVARDYTVVFAIIARGDGPLGEALPFLSKIGLSHAARQIRGWGYELALTRIPQL